MEKFQKLYLKISQSNWQFLLLHITVDFLSRMKDVAYFCDSAYVLRFSRYLSFLWVVPTNTGIFLPSSKLCGENRTQQVLLVSKKKIWGNHAFSEIIKLQVGKKMPYIALYFVF